jgi:LmbE family N-acetylglucosaminyl deacetylase
VTARAFQAFDLAALAELWPDLGPAHAPVRFWAYCVPEAKAKRLTARRLYSVPDAEVDAELDVAAHIPAKRAAVAAHASQKPFIDWLEDQLGGLEGYWAKDSFVLAAARVPLPAGPRPVGDLFAGMP